ncbi:hypothetical protein GCM10010401_14350 [Rarobacter faecitabidus]|uniref:Uncharacterized protein n=1 Tax=Rarobacter faecitabidus TaxID=13243 RepID=A0A542ZDX0_RARFA|nr:hypothetical protein [Rarobacter faecitabidus]TQL58518.1 hypothetical protein FB461_1933 [Rarobacter faecitabidus]
MTTTESTALSDRVVSILRTAVPTLWGSAVVWLLALIPALESVRDALLSTGVRELVVGVAIVVWYALWRWLEPRMPDWLTRLVLGSARAPGYALLAGPVAEITDVDGRPVRVDSNGIPIVEDSGTAGDH